MNSVSFRFVRTARNDAVTASRGFRPAELLPLIRSMHEGGFRYEICLSQLCVFRSYRLFSSDEISFKKLVNIFLSGTFNLLLNP